METSISSHTRRVPEALSRLVTATACGLLALSLCGLLAAQEVTVLDLTKPYDYRPTRRGAPVFGGGGISGMKVGPDPYRIPLEVKIKRVDPETLNPRDKFVLEIELTNAGMEPFFFLVSRNIQGVQRDENKGRRTATILLHLNELPESTKTIAILVGSPSVRGSLKRLNQGDSILVRVETDFYYHTATPVIPDDQKEVVLRAGYREEILKDGQFRTENISETILSTSSFTLALKHE